MSDKQLSDAKKLLEDEKDNLSSFMGWGDSEEDAQQQLKIDAIDEHIRVIEQQLRIRPQDRSSIPPQGRSRSPHFKHRGHAKPRGAVAKAVTKPISCKPVFPHEFLEKPMEYIVVLAGHGGCHQFESPRPKGHKFRTEFDTIFTSELGMPAYVMYDGSYKYFYDFVYPFPTDGFNLVSRLQKNMDFIKDTTTKPPRLDFKKQHENVTDMIIFSAGDYDSLPDDGLFVFDSRDPPETVEEVMAKDIAPLLLKRNTRNDPLQPNPNGSYSLQFPLYLNEEGEDVKLSDLLKTGGVLQKHGLTPENTTVIVVSCRVVIGGRDADWCALQSPSTSASVAAASLLQPAQPAQPAHQPRRSASVSVPRGDRHAGYTDDPQLGPIDESSEGEDEGWPSWSETGGRTKSKRQSKRQSKRNK